VSRVWYKLWITMKYKFVTNVIHLQLHHYQLYTHQHVVKVVTTTRTYSWTHDIVASENSFRKGLLRLENNLYNLLKFLWHNQWHGVHVFHFLDIWKKSSRYDICINKYKHYLIAIVTPHLYYVYMSQMWALQ